MEPVQLGPQKQPWSNYPRPCYGFLEVRFQLDGRLAEAAMTAGAKELQMQREVLFQAWPRGWALNFFWGTWLGRGFKYFFFHPYLGIWSNLTNIFQMRWNHQLDENSWYGNHPILSILSRKSIR